MKWCEFRAYTFLLTLFVDCSPSVRFSFLWLFQSLSLSLTIFLSFHFVPNSSTSLKISTQVPRQKNFNPLMRKPSRKKKVDCYCQHRKMHVTCTDSFVICFVISQNVDIGFVFLSKIFWNSKMPNNSYFLFFFSFLLVL